LTNLREEKINLMNELNGEIRKSNKLAQNYKSLEGDFSKLKREVDRLRRRKHEESSNEGESIIHKMHREEPVRPRTTDDIPTREVPTRHRERYVTAQNYDEVPTRKYERYEDVQSRGKGGESLES
jgi:chromosome segregation ATPase